MSSIDIRFAKLRVAKAKAAVTPSPKAKTPYNVLVKKRRVTVDFEGRSEVNVLEVGGWIYSRHASTEVVCLCWSYDGEDKVYLWHPLFVKAGFKEHGREDLLELFRRITDEGYEVEAHNAFFEMSMWTNVCHARMNWPMVPMNQWRCSAAKGSSFNLPRALKDVCQVLGLTEQKDMDGHKAMLKCAKPKKITKKSPEGGWHEDPDDLRTTFKYCAQDVRSEKALSAALRDPSPHELKIWQMDQRMNLRGVYCDVDAAAAAIRVASRLMDGYIAELQAIVNDEEITPTKREKLKAWVNANGTYLPNTKGDTIDLMLDDPSETMTPEVRRVLEICRAANRTSISKYSKMLETADTDSRMRDLMMYWGASTGRWTGRLVQPHNFVRGNIKDMDGLWQDIVDMDLGKRSDDWLATMWGDVMEALSFATRGAITATPGKKLWVADYAAIEARVLFWLFEETEALEVFRRNEDIYLALATEIYKRKITKEDAKERQLGKKGILGLGYQMGAARFKDECEADGILITLDMAEKVVEAYRAKYRKVSKGWYAQEAAAIRAVRSKGKIIKCGRISWAMRGRFLHCKLPSGRVLSYFRPKIRMKKVPWGPEKKPCLVYLGQDTLTKAWMEIDTYGGKLVENIVQAIARDLMADAMLRIDESDLYELLLSVHDEVICEADEGKGNLAEYEALMAKNPPWAHDCPTTAVGWSGIRYRKQ